MIASLYRRIFLLPVPPVIKTQNKKMKNISKKLHQNGTLKKNTGKSEAGITKGLRCLFVNELQEIYWAEKALVKAIPKIIKRATADDVIKALARHLEITKEHVTRIEEIFSAIDEKKKPKKCRVISGLIREAKEVMKETKAGSVRDAGIISAIQKIEHYEIATYGTLCNCAKILQQTDAFVLLTEILIQEKVADEKLTEIAGSFIIVKATNTEEVAGITIEISSPIL
jgi:ferritin-like metal-binding protein YciE